MSKKSKKHSSGCSCCGNGSPKRKPYGGQRKKHWCPYCDMDLVNPVNKKAERQKAKKDIKKQLDD